MKDHRRTISLIGLGLLLLIGSVLAATDVAVADSVVSFTLINANTDQPIAGFNPLANGSTLNLATLPTTKLNIRANTSPATTGSVKFGLDANPSFRTDNTPPYALAGDSQGNYHPWTPSVGEHTLTATTYTQTRARGTAGTPLVITFTVTNSAPTNQPPLANAGPDQTIVFPNSATLNGSATDDGLPNPPGTLTYAWSKVSGPGTVTFGNASAATTSAAFSAAGTYVLRLTASDSVLSGADEVTVTANSGGGGGTQIRINAGGPAYTDTVGQPWLADVHFTGGQTFATTQPISGTEDDTLYKTERFGNFSYQIPVANGVYGVILHFAEIYWNAAGQRLFDVLIEGAPVIANLDIWATVGQYAAHQVSIETAVNDGVLNINFVTVVDNAKISAIEVNPHHNTGHPFLHVVIEPPPPSWIVDFDGNGSEPVPLAGSGSHTHELGHQLTAWTWTKGATTLGTTPDITPVLAVGSHTITLTIADDNSPPQTLSDSVVINVFPITAVGGVLTKYYPANGVPLTTLIDTLPASPGFVEVRPTLRIDAVSGKIGGSPFATNAVAVMTGTFTARTSGTYQFVLSGGVASRLYLNGALVSGPVSLASGPHALEARFAADTTASLPAQVLVSLNGAAAVPIAAADLAHDQTNLSPFINGMPSSGSPSGGETVVIQGVGFFPSGSVVVHWGGSDLGPSGITAKPGEITVVTPPGSGTIAVTVETPNGVSNSISFTYTAGTVPISFAGPEVIASVAEPTQAAWGPDGRLYVGTVGGTIKIYTFNDDYGVTATQTVNTIAGLLNSNILGIGFNPFDPASPVRLYVSHNGLFANGGGCFTGSSSYSGQVSVLEGPNFSATTPLIAGLPVSNHDHGVNAPVFDNQGDLWIAQGGNTNAGVADCDIGGLPESPLSGAVLRARTSKAGFSGTIEYVETATGFPENDQVFGGSVDVAPGVDVAVFAHGLRNPFDIVLTTKGRLYGTDNGPNAGFGAASTSATTQGPDPTAPDEVLRLVEGHYYGHPNRNRGRYASRENIYRNPSVTAILGQYTAPLATVPSSSNGIDEYRATTFNSGMRGQILVQQLNGSLFRVKLTPDGNAVESVQEISPGPTALDVLAGPGGAIIAIDHGSNAITVSRPNAGAVGMVAYDIFPWRATADGGTPFTMGGVGFGNLSNTTVTIGGVSAVLTSVSATRIKGLIPAKPSPTGALLDVVVQSAGQQSTIPAAFRYLLAPGEGKGVWSTYPQMPIALGEVAGGIINGVLYLVGNSSSATLAFDLATETWLSNLAVRPFVGDHHAAEVINGKLYLFGGLGGGSEGKVQIYNPATNSWSPGANVPFATGSASTALIGGQVYLAGGIVGSSTVTTAAVYNPQTNSWSLIAPMPLGRNHTAAGTDGSKLYVFGGRGPGSGDDNVVAIGFDDVEVYDPQTDMWACSCTPGSPLPPAPQKRGGMGKAPFYGGEFYVIGGETTSSGTGQVTGNVYNRVDVFDPATPSWRLEALLPTARHGIFPLVYDGRIFVTGGGTQAGFSSSKVVEIFAR
jgi:N-acetylneuraminic acid mutarotase